MALVTTGQLRWLSPREVWPMQGLELLAGIAKRYSYKHLIALAGAAFHMPSAAGFLTGMIATDSW